MFLRGILLFLEKIINMLKFGILGYPLTTTLSPLIYRKAFEICSLNAEYSVYPFEDVSLFKDIISNEGLSGFNVTIPHKRNALSLVDVIDIDAERIGAINTVRIDNGKLYATNTDWQGFLSALSAEKVSLEGAGAVVLGTGGSAVAACYALAYAKVKSISIISRRPDEALKIELLLKRGFRDVSVICSDFSERFHLKTCDLFVNCTPIGMYTDDNLGAAGLLDLVPKSCVLFDLCYRDDSSLTYFTNIARDLNIRAFDGLSMLVMQAAVSFNFMTGLCFDSDEMLSYLRRTLCA